MTLDSFEAKLPKKTRLEFLNFEDHYVLTGDILGSGAFSRVESCQNLRSKKQNAVKIIDKIEGIFQRSKILKEIETYHLCQGHPNIIQMEEYFESNSAFYLVFEKLNGGPLLRVLQSRQFLTENEASWVAHNLAK